MRRNSAEPRKHAVVIGASMGGLSAAAALATAYERVTLLERDELPDHPAHRRGVPQSKHAHGLQPGGLRALEDLLPGVTADLIAAGVRDGDLCGDCTWVVGGNRLRRENSDVLGIGMTRPFLEHGVRSRVAALPNVTIRTAVEVTGLVAPDRRQVRGVVLRAGGRDEQLAADLVVDASGRASRLPAWLAELGYAAPAEETVTCRMAYLTRRWQLAEDSTYRNLVSIVTPAADPRFGVMIAQEDGSYIVTLGGLLDSGPERTEDGYLDFAANLLDPVIANALAGATPVDELRSAHFPASRRRRYDKLRDFPQGLLALGDSIASFNPMYGQGMTVAALEAVLLRDQLARGVVRARRFFNRAHRIEDVAWKISTGGDLRFDAVEGKRTPDQKMFNRYLDRLLAAARTDPVLARQFLTVAGFIDRPEALFRPSIVWRVFTAPRGVSVPLQADRACTPELAER
ncbi:MAG TPA: FAD-dependent monooxygenase [Jatrophihabitans sp.]|nr:FAD-dependent monooxygenase [Jatrophihabitans sp.]